MSTDNPELIDVIRVAIRGALGAMSIIGVGYVEQYDPYDQKATISSALNFCYWDEEEEVLVQYAPSPVGHCPVLHMSSGGFFSAMPVDEGDFGIILTCDRALDGWKETGAFSNDVGDGRRFNFVDSMFLPMGRAFQNALEFTDKHNEKWVWGEETPTGLRFELGNGKFEFGTSAVRFLEQVADSITLASKISTFAGTSVVTTLLGPQPLSNAGQLASVALQLAQIRAKIDLIRGTLND